MNENVKALTDLSGKKLALQKSLLTEQSLQGELHYYDNVEECMEAVHKGKRITVTATAMRFSIIWLTTIIKNLFTFAQSENWTQKYCFGIRRPVDITALSIMNKVIRALPEEQVNRFLYQNAYDAGNLTFPSM